MGNSEVGHMNLGSGRVVQQGVVVIDADIAAGMRIIAPEGFLKEAVSENVLAGNAMGRRATYMVFFLLGMGLYSAVPSLGHLNSTAPFVVAFVIILSMYGGGFATIPAYLRDVFGTMNVGAIHGRLLTAWSVAGVLGPVLVNYIRQFQIEHGVAKAQAYSITMYIMCGLLLVGFLCNLAMHPVDERFHYRGPGSTK